MGKKKGHPAALPPALTRAQKKAVGRPPSGSVAQQCVRFSFEYADTGYDGGWGFHTDDASSHQVMGILCEQGRRTWGEVWADTAGPSHNRHKKHHGQSVGSLCAEAQARLGTLKLDEVFDDTMFRFRQGGLGRLWGFIAGDVFHVVWWDPGHNVYPTEPG